MQVKQLVQEGELYVLAQSRDRVAGRAAPGLTPCSVLENFAAVQMIDEHLPTTKGRELLLSRYTEPELSLLLNQLNGSWLPEHPQNRRRSRFAEPL